MDLGVKLAGALNRKGAGTKCRFVNGGGDNEIMECVSFVCKCIHVSC